jgi:hypothetical protein
MGSIWRRIEKPRRARCRSLPPLAPSRKEGDASSRHFFGFFRFANERVRVQIPSRAPGFRGASEWLARGRPCTLTARRARVGHRLATVVELDQEPACARAGCPSTSPVLDRQAVEAAEVAEIRRDEDELVDARDGGDLAVGRRGRPPSLSKARPLARARAMPRTPRRRAGSEAPSSPPPRDTSRSPDASWRPEGEPLRSRARATRRRRCPALPRAPRSSRTLASTSTKRGLSWVRARYSAAESRTATGSPCRVISIAVPPSRALPS